MPAILKNLVVTRIDRVDLGANQNADILLYKRAPIDKAKWSTAYMNTLPDSSFAVIEPGGEKDDEGKTTPRSLRHLPFKDENGKVDLTHLRNALSQLPKTDLSAALKEKAGAKLQAAAKAAGIGEEGDMKKMLMTGVGYGCPCCTSRSCPCCEGCMGASCPCCAAGKCACCAGNDPCAAGAAACPGGEPMAKNAELDLKVIPEAQRAAVDALQKRAGLVEDLEKRATTAETRVKALETEVGELKKKLPTPSPEDLEKAALPESVRKRLEALEEKDETATYVAKVRKEIPRLVGITVEAFAPLLRRIAKRLTTAEDETEVIRLVKSLAEITKDSKLLKEIGASGDGGAEGGTPYERASATAKRLVEEGKEKTFHKAMERVWKEKPELYAEHTAQRGQRSAA